MNLLREPDAGNPHVRFDEREVETERFSPPRHLSTLPFSVSELGNIVAGAFAHPDEAGNGEYLPLVGDFLSFNEIIDTLNGQGHKFSFKQIPKEAFAALFPGAGELAEMFNYWEVHTYLGSDSSDRIALANKIAGAQPTRFSTWACLNFPVQVA